MEQKKEDWTYDEFLKKVLEDDPEVIGRIGGDNAAELFSGGNGLTAMQEFEQAFSEFELYPKPLELCGHTFMLYTYFSGGDGYHMLVEDLGDKVLTSRYDGVFTDLSTVDEIYDRYKDRVTSEESLRVRFDQFYGKITPDEARKNYNYSRMIVRDAELESCSAFK